MTGHWRKAGEPLVSADEILVSQWPSLWISSLCVPLVSLSLLPWESWFIQSYDLKTQQASCCWLPAWTLDSYTHISTWESAGNSTLTCSKWALDVHSPSLTPTSPPSLQYLVRPPSEPKTMYRCPPSSLDCVPSPSHFSSQLFPCPLSQ